MLREPCGNVRLLRKGLKGSALSKGKIMSEMASMIMNIAMTHDQHTRRPDIALTPL